MTQLILEDEDDVVAVVVPAAGADMPTQYHSSAHSDEPHLWPELPRAASHA